jgi:hypothetical protein
LRESGACCLGTGQPEQQARKEARTTGFKEGAGRLSPWSEYALPEAHKSAREHWPC